MIAGSPEQQDVNHFHLKFGVPMALAPSFLDPAAQKFRSKFMQEELDEFNDAYAEGDMTKAADALVDLAYVLHGTALMMGLSGAWTQLWNEVQRANMTKARATNIEQSVRKSKLDVIKPPGWTPPDHRPALGAGPWPTFNASGEEA